MAVASPTSPVSPTKSSSTNTLVLTSLPPLFFHPQVQNALRSQFESFGRIHTWAPLSGLGRVIVVYYDEKAAEEAKSLDELVIASESVIHTTLRVYRAQSTNIDALDNANSGSHHLAPPAVEKNFLISPPGSPPVGWEAVREDPPNSSPLAADLIAALERLQMNHGTQDGGREILVRAEEVNGGIGVWVEDVEHMEGNDQDDEHQRRPFVDGAEEGNWYAQEEQRLRMIPPRTARPPTPLPP